MRPKTIAAIGMLLLAACNGGDTASRSFAALNVQFAGLPAGADAYARLEGPNGTLYFTASRSFPNDAPGSYMVTAFEVLAGGSVMQPTPASQSFTLAEGESRSVTVTYSSAQAFDLQLQEVVGTGAGLSGPIDLQAPPGDARLFIADRPGQIRIVQGGVLQPIPFLDISSRVLTDEEAGLLSFAFHPQYASGQPFVFVHFIENVPNGGDIVVERYQISSDPNLLDVSSAQAVIRIPHRNSTNHYGGRVAFGPDGMLYLSTGDGGGGGDTFANGQNRATLLGKMLRLDVSMLPYTIPGDNPTWLNVGRNENWAIGLRNPWRYAFDSATGQLYLGDVGQGRREEIDIVASNARGLNYGWNIMEGTLCFAGPCTSRDLTAPAHEYDHGQGCSVIGGYVYRGAALPELRGRYLYSDFCLGFMRSLRHENGIVTERLQWAGPATNVFSLGQDGAGELYILIWDGRVLKIVRK